MTADDRSRFVDPADDARTTEGILHQAGWGQNCTPITPIRGQSSAPIDTTVLLMLVATRRFRCPTGREAAHLLLSWQRAPPERNSCRRRWLLLCGMVNGETHCEGRGSRWEPRCWNGVFDVFLRVRGLYSALAFNTEHPYGT
jgi:hypothetical protein